MTDKRDPYRPVATPITAPLASGPDDDDALKVAEQRAETATGQIRVVISVDRGLAFLAELDSLPEDLAGAVWAGFWRGMVAHAGGETVHVHDGGKAAH
ncbi:MAG: hypothetical protein O7I42_01365 [Alphaproteobacteria bacterium]|nr:hypothetical protein [Alphaproteobacteria bacterium]